MYIYIDNKFYIEKIYDMMEPPGCGARGQSDSQESGGGPFFTEIKHGNGNPPVLGDFPIETSIYRGFPMSTF